jgi:hypothetical protein
MATKTQWWDKNGDVHEGYIKNGQTYLDEAGTARVPVGATVQTNGGTYKMTSSGGVPTMATAKNQYQQNSNAAINAYQAAGKVQEERIKSATDAAIAEVNRQKRIAEQQQIDADKAAMDAYRAAANPFGAMEEQRVRLGLDESGYAESSKLRLASDLAAQQVANLRAKNEQIQALDVQIAQAKASGQYELANMLEARAQNVMQQKLALEGNLYSGDMQAISQAENVRQFEENMAYQREQEQKQWDYQTKTDEYNKALAKAEVLAQFGNFEGYRALGYTDEQINGMRRAYEAAAAAEAAARMRTGSSGSSSASAKAQKAAETTEYLQSVLDYINANGLDFEDFMENSADSWGITSVLKPEFRQMYMAQQAATTAENKTKNTNYQNVKMDIRRMAQQGSSADEIINYIERNRGGMTESEINNLFAILDAEQPNWIR